MSRRRAYYHLQTASESKIAAVRWKIYEQQVFKSIQQIWFAAQAKILLSGELCNGKQKLHWTAKTLHTGIIWSFRGAFVEILLKKIIFFIEFLFFLKSPKYSAVMFYEKIWHAIVLEYGWFFPPYLFTLTSSYPVCRMILSSISFHLNYFLPCLQDDFFSHIISPYLLVTLVLKSQFILS